MRQNQTMKTLVGKIVGSVFLICALFAFSFSSSAELIVETPNTYSVSPTFTKDFKLADRQEWKFAAINLDNETALLAYRFFSEKGWRLINWETCKTNFEKTSCGLVLNISKDGIFSATRMSNKPITLMYIPEITGQNVPREEKIAAVEKFYNALISKVKIQKVRIDVWLFADNTAMYYFAVRMRNRTTTWETAYSDSLRNPIYKPVFGRVPPNEDYIRQFCESVKPKIENIGKDLFDGFYIQYSYIPTPETAKTEFIKALITEIRKFSNAPIRVLNKDYKEIVVENKISGCDASECKN